MVNYTFHRLDVSGSDQSLIDSMFDHIALPPDEAAAAEAKSRDYWLATEEHEQKPDEPDIPDALYFDYNQVIPMPEHLKEPPPDDEEINGDTSSSSSLLSKLGSILYSPIRWYHRHRAIERWETERSIWIEENWGSDCSEPMFSALYYLRRDQAREGNSLRFFTARCEPPTKVIIRLAELYPSLRFNFGYFTEGFGNVGLLTAENGVSKLQMFDSNSDEGKAVIKQNGIFNLEDEEDIIEAADAVETAAAATTEAASDDEDGEESKHSITIATRT